MERDGDHFDIDDEFVASNDDESDYDRIERTERRNRASAPVKKGKAAWSKVEDALIEKRLKRELEDFGEGR